MEEGTASKGPNLWGVLERDKGSSTEYELYSKVISRTEGPWTYEELNAFLVDPKGSMPGTGMAEFRGVESVSDGADLIAFLRVHGDQPPPLPK